MKHALVDLGSNTIRMSVYETSDNNFKLLFSEKETVGLAGYVTQDNQMTQPGLDKACATLKSFSDILYNLDINDLHVFATASLRNVVNTDECIEYIRSQTGIAVEVISGREEAQYGCEGALLDVGGMPGLIFDVGGGSTEIVHVKNGRPTSGTSLPIGSLVLFRKNVSGLLPKKDELNLIRRQAAEMIVTVPQTKIICGVGGTARALLRISNACFGRNDNEIEEKEFAKVRRILSKRGQQARDLILKNCPDRLHTIIPGMMIIQRLIKLSECKKIIVSKYGVREGYLCKKIMRPMT